MKEMLGKNEIHENEIPLTEEERRKKEEEERRKKEEEERRKRTRNILLLLSGLIAAGSLIGYCKDNITALLKGTPETEVTGVVTPAGYSGKNETEPASGTTSEGEGGGNGKGTIDTSDAVNDLLATMRNKRNVPQGGSGTIHVEEKDKNGGSQAFDSLFTPIQGGGYSFKTNIPLKNSDLLEKAIGYAAKYKKDAGKIEFGGKNLSPKQKSIFEDEKRILEQQNGEITFYSPDFNFTVSLE